MQGGDVRGQPSGSLISAWSPINSRINSRINSETNSEIISDWFPIQSPIQSLINSAIIAMIVPVIASTIVSLIISVWSPVNSVTNTIFQTPTSPKPRILASVFRKPWPKIEGSYVHFLSNVASLACIYWWSHWWWVLRLFSLNIPIISLCDIHLLLGLP